ncbi:MAG: YsnF/AvaK domain-containing protein [Rhodospirillales bacterium]|nr:YsnF/AvaK domain-containing protein [Rhodospirillales bacterium]
MQTLVAVYPTRAEAENVRNRLLGIGIADREIGLSPEGSGMGSAATQQQEPESFWDWLFGATPSESEQDWYRSNLRDGKTALSVRLHDDEQRARAESILEEANPLTMDGGTEGAIESTSASGTAPPRPTRESQGEQRIPVAKEELEVGKRHTERTYRVRAYTVERPAEAQVTLRDERVIVERRPASGSDRSGDEAFPDREFEVTERHEEPVVAKKAGATEEVVIRKDVKERTETVGDKVRETKVEVDRMAAGDKPAKTKPKI